MNLRRIIRGLTIGLVGAALMTGVSCRWSGDQASLPALVRYPELSAVFNQELAERYQRAALGDDADAVRSLARLYQANRLYDEARACYEVIAASPASLTARDHYYLADIARQRNELELVRQELRAVLAVEPGYVPARLALAEMLLKIGDDVAAANEYAAVVTEIPDQRQAQIGLARLELQNGDVDAAVSRLEQLLAAHPGSTEAAALLAQLLRRRGDVDRAEALADLSQSRPEPGPADPWMAELLSNMYDVGQLGLEAEYSIRRGQIETAEAYLRRIESIEPSSPVPPIVRGQAAVLVNQPETAVAHFREALAKGGDWETVCPSITQALLKLDRPAEAVSFIAEYYKQRPDSIPIAKAYADALVRHGDSATARPVLEQVLEAEPNLRSYNMHLAQIFWEADERNAAVPYLERVASIHPGDIPSRALLAEYHLGNSDPVAAIAPLEQALRYATPQTEVYEGLVGLLRNACIGAGVQAAERGAAAEASDYLERVTQVAPDDPKTYAALASVYVRLQHYAGAQAALERLLSLQPGNPTVLLSLGDVVHRQGATEDARQHWRQALEWVAPGDRDLRAALEGRLRGELSQGALP